ncbi:MAG TPA: DUF3455 domain-containing protein [Casimicrobiaceae bacterium]|jgi:hypothetical protein|nr:DUF3455 domain-containing protein [Casimicrobiaceae bacterium]
MNRVSKVLLNTVWLPAIWLTANVSAQVSEAVAKRDRTVIATLHAEGAQIYECKLDPGKSPAEVHALTWQFREPVAALFADGKSIGRHYAGPNWDHIDGSGVKAKVTASTPGAKPNDIPWLNLDVVDHRGNGILSDATTVQRVNTKGGVAKGSCESAGSYLSVPYSADYVFQRKS